MINAQGSVYQVSLTACSNASSKIQLLGTYHIHARVRHNELPSHLSLLVDFYPTDQNNAISIHGYSNRVTYKNIKISCVIFTHPTRVTPNVSFHYVITDPLEPVC